MKELHSKDVLIQHVFKYLANITQTDRNTLPNALLQAWLEAIEDHEEEET